MADCTNDTVKLIELLGPMLAIVVFEMRFCAALVRLKVGGNAGSVGQLVGPLAMHAPSAVLLIVKYGLPSPAPRAL